MRKYSLILFVILFTTSCTNSDKLKNNSEPEIKSNQMSIQTEQNSPKHYYVKILNSIPHDSTSYTQGLFVNDGFLYESTGQYGESSLRQIEISTGKVLKKISIAERFFAEGIAIYENKIYQLTWQEGTCFVYDLKTFKQTSKFNYNGEGWGLANFTDNKFVMSDGTNFLKIINPINFSIEKTISVLDNDKAIENINEMEMINGEIWANIYMTDVIAIINPETGNVTGYIDCSILRTTQNGNNEAEVLNGIAYNPTNKKVFLTGKNWNKIFEVEIVEQN